MTDSWTAPRRKGCSNRQVAEAREEVARGGEAMVAAQAAVREAEARVAVPAAEKEEGARVGAVGVVMVGRVAAGPAGGGLVAEVMEKAVGMTVKASLVGGGAPAGR